MLYELRAHLYPEGRHHGRCAEPLQNEGYPAFSNEEKARLVGYFTSDVGTLNQIVHLWRFEDDGERRAHWASVYSNEAFMKFAGKLRPNILSQENKLLNQAPWGPKP